MNNNLLLILNFKLSMGHKLSVDKHTSSLPDILDLNLRALEKVKFEANIPSNITQHLKVSNYLTRSGDSLTTIKLKK